MSLTPHWSWPPTVTARLDEQWQMRDGQLVVGEQHPTEHPLWNGSSQ